MKFNEETEYIFKSINDSFNLERLLLNHVEIDEFKQAIERGLYDYNKTLESEQTQDIILTEEQFNKIATELSNTQSWFREDCDCGDFIIYLDGLGYFTMSTYCSKSMFCYDGMLWDLDDCAYIYDKSVFKEEYDWDNIELKYNINRKQVLELREIANEAIRQLKNKDEYGEEL